MAKQSAVFQPRSVASKAITFVNADGTTAKDLYVAGAEDSLVRALGIVSDDTAARLVHLHFHDGTTEFELGAISVPASSGVDGSTPAVDGLSFGWLPLDARSKKFLQLKTGCKLRAKMDVAVTSGKTVTLITVGDDY